MRFEKVAGYYGPIALRSDTVYGMIEKIRQEVDSTKRIVLITEELSNSTPYKRTLLQLFGQEIQIRSFSVRNHDYPSMPKDADLYLISCTSSDAYKEVSAYLPADKPTVPAKITYLKRDIEALQQLPVGTRAILVNFSMQMAIESIAELHRLGITQIQLFPYCPGMAVPPRIEMAITPGEPQCVPPEFTSVLNLGSRVFSAETILEIGLHLGFSWLPASEHFRTYIQDLADPGRSLAALWNASLQTETYLDMLMGALKMGIVGVDVQGRVFAANATASGITGGVDIGGEIGTLLPDLGDAGSSYKQVRLMKIQDVFVNVSVVPVDWQGTRIGSFLLLQRFTEEEKRQHKFRAQLQDWGYRAKYTMDDIIGESEAIRQVKALAEKMAQTDSAILLTGESGTGKDLFYRLNTLPLEIPPLRERGEDLFLIAAEIKKRFGYAYILAPDAREVLRRYCWEGNVRELSNLIEYLAVVDKPEITSEDLPPYLRATRSLSPAAPSLPDDFSDFAAQTAGQEELYRFLLQALSAAEGGIGRGQLCRLAEQEGLLLTDQAARDALQALNRLGLISVSRGRGGSRLTLRGRQLAEAFSK